MADNRMKASNGRQEKTQKGLLTRARANTLIPFMLYLALWGVLYIGNRHYAEQVELQVSELQQDLQTYRSEYLTMKADLMQKTKQSEVARMVDSLGLNELTTPPEKLRVPSDQSSQKP